MSVSDHVRVETRGSVYTVILDRPERRNAIDPKMAQDLAQAFRDFENDESAAVAVLYGIGGHFSAGADLKAIADGNLHPIEPDPSKDGPLGCTRMLLSKPVIAAVEGYAVAGGLELACWCDLRVVAEDATFGVFCRRVGVPLVDGGTQRLPEIVGLGRALDLILTGREVPATEAHAMGLATRVVPNGSTREEAEALALTLASMPQLCMRSDRRATYEGVGMTEKAGLAREAELGRQVLSSGEPIEAAKRYARRRRAAREHPTDEEA
ncbi:enoyl-CoA hydratase [Longibacter salinarum]|uniref:Enoyl-CoA hydratase n=1 Tax=Longibacter salinarum TaxID=1850348 RepID=A0A2A8CTP2_9BACT|nr:crotonase/enoyl-CoA hydratase family protein [Longibacter salinarum]PEN10965.1 enoyl-CoA hydratase [Longibacter salinarum]